MLFQFSDIQYSPGEKRQKSITVSGTLKPGEVLVIQGPSGSGKSTLLRILARLVSCPSGNAFLQGKKWSEISPTLWRARVHYLAQKPVTFDGTFAQNLKIPFLTTALKGKFPLDDNLPQDLMKNLLLPQSLWHQDARTLSGGEASRLAFLRALIIDPTILLLDEPTAALDEQARQAFYSVLNSWLKQPNKAAMLVSHIDDYQILDNVSFLKIENQG